jgi:PAS domain S-box-containing protein
LPAYSLIARPAMAIEMKGSCVSSLLRVLMLVDTKADSDMLARELRRTGFELAVRRATTEAAYLAELESPLDLILVDNALLEFDVMRALQILRTSELDIPLIVVTESAGEAAAIECVSLGAADFLFKDRPARLGTAVVHALDQRELRAHARVADAALRESEERFRSAFEYAAIGMALVGLDGRWLQANPALCDFTGYTEQELLATTFQAITHPDDLEIDIINTRSLLAGEIFSYQMEKRYFHKHGATIWALLNVSLVRDAQRQPRYFVSQIQDITERKQTDVARSRLAAIVDSSDDAIIGKTLDGMVISWNAGAEQMYGYTTEEMIGRPITMLLLPGPPDEETHILDRITRGERISNYETMRIRKDGRRINVSLTISPIKDVTGVLTGISVISRDIGERKRDERVLRQKTAFIQLFQEVAVAANLATSLDQALQTAVDQICAHIGWPVGHVYLPDPEMPGALIPTSIWHLEDTQRFATFRKITEGVRLAPGVGLPGQVVASRKPAWISDIILDVSTPRTRLIKDIGVRAGFALPVLLGDEVAAVLEFFAVEEIEPDEALLDVLHHVGTQLGRVVERARGEAALRESQERLTLLNSISAGIIAGLPTADVIGRTVTALGRTFPALRVTYATVDEHGGLTTHAIAQPSEMPEYSSRAIDLSAAPEYLHALRTGEPISVEDIVHDSRRGPLAERLLAEGTAALLSVPVQYPDHQIGALTFHAPEPRSWSEHEAATLLGVAEYLAVAFRNDHAQLERARAEAALRAAEAQYRMLVEQIPAIIYKAEINKHSSTSYVSPQIQATLGFSPEEWIANPDLWLEQVHPDDRARMLETVALAHASDAPILIEYRSFTRDGRMVWLRDDARAVRDESGQPLFLQGITHDITERKQSEAALLEREAYFRALIEHSADAITLLAVDGTILYGSPATPRVLGYAVQNFVGRNAFDLIHPDDQALFVEKLGHIIGLPEATVSIHARIQHADGSWRDLEGMFTNLLDDPAVCAIVTNYRDITDGKRAEDALRASERLYRTLASNFPNGAVVLFDHSLRFTIADGAGMGAFGLTREEMEGRTIWDVYPPKLSAEPEIYYRAALAGTPHVRETIQGDHTYAVHTLPVRDEHGEIIAGMVMTQDITERKRIEEALIEERALLARRVDERTADLSAANAELARTAILKDEFLASMSHELRTPLNAVLGLSEALQEEVYGPLNDRQRRSLHSIEESGRHLLELINDILDLAKIGAGKLELELEPSSIETICQASLRLIKQLAHEKRLSVDLTIDPAVTMLHVDARRVKQILVNLLSNAVKFTPEGGSIGLEVAGDTARQAVDLTVWDTGIGIAQDQMARLFQPFVQLDSRLARQYEGTGLGLALVYRMVELHGGSIGVTSAIDSGSRFTVALPWHTANAGAQARAPAAPDVAANERVSIRHVLVVEDSPTTADQIMRYLHELEIESVTVCDGVEVVALAIAEQPDLIILDLLLPNISGWDVLVLLKAAPRTLAIPVLIISVIDERPRGLELGAAEYLLKPVARTDLQRVLPMLAPAPRGSAIPHAPRATGTPARAIPPPLVLLAEDNEANITMIADYLGTCGYQVVVARNGAEAIARAREARPAIVVMDIQMPGMDGLEATRRIRAIADLVDLPIIALTALAMPGDRERCLAAGANDYLCKPVSLRGLTILIEHTLRPHSSQQRNHR